MRTAKQEQSKKSGERKLLRSCRAALDVFRSVVKCGNVQRWTSAAVRPLLPDLLRNQCCNTTGPYINLWRRSPHKNSSKILNSFDCPSPHHNPHFVAAILRSPQPHPKAFANPQLDNTAPHFTVSTVAVPHPPQPTLQVAGNAAHHKPGDVLQEDERDVPLAAQLNEMCGCTSNARGSGKSTGGNHSL